MKNKSNPTTSVLPPALLVLVLLALHILSGCHSRPSRVTGLTPAAISPADRRVVNSPGFDELWVIARSSEPLSPTDEDSPGSGALMTEIEGKEIPMPLKHTDVRAYVSGYIGSVQVVQQFHNPYDTKIEAVYVFPLPHDAAVN